MLRYSLSTIVNVFVDCFFGGHDVGVKTQNLPFATFCTTLFPALYCRILNPRKLNPGIPSSLSSFSSVCAKSSFTRFEF